MPLSGFVVDRSRSATPFGLLVVDEPWALPSTKATFLVGKAKHHQVPVVLKIVAVSA